MIQNKQLRANARRIALYPLTPLTLAGSANATRSAPQSIAIPMQNKIVVIETENILYLNAESNYTHVHCLDGTRIIAAQTLKNFNTCLCEPAFLRVHKSYLVQTKYLKEYMSGSGMIVLTDSIRIPVSRAKRNVVMRYLKSLMV